MIRLKEKIRNNMLQAVTAATPALLLLALATFVHAGVNEWSGSGPFSTGTGTRVVNALAVSLDGGTVYAGTGNGALFSYTVASAPTASTGLAAGLTTTTAILNATVKANNADAAVSFEYGLTAAYGTSIPAAQSPVTGNAITAVSAAIAGLTPGTTYHFRVVAVNAQGTGSGQDALFTTALNGACGGSNGQTLLSAPGAGLCGAGTASSVSGSGPWTWTCSGLYGGTNAGCGANIQTYTVSLVAGAGGGFSPNTAQTVGYNGTTTFTLVPDTGKHAASVTGCGGSLSGNIYATGAIIADCTITATFAVDTFTIKASTDLLGYWPLDEGAGAATDDASGNGNSGGIASGAAWSSDRPAALSDNAASLLFDGSADGYVSAGSGIDLAGKSWTIAFWAKRAYPGANGTAVGLGTMGGTDLSLQIGFRDTDVFTCAFFGDDLDTAQTYTDAGWRHWTCVFDAATKTRSIYCDGALVVSDTAGANFQGAGPFIIGGSGRGGGSGSMFNGNIDDVRVYGSALPAVQIASLAVSAPANGTFDPAGTRTVNYGVDQAYTITPNPGSSIVDVVVDGEYSQGAVTGYSFTDVTGNHTIKAFFSVNTYTVSVSASANGTVSPNTGQTAYYNSTKTFTITPDAGYSIQTVTGCNGNLSGNTYTTGAITGDCFVTASFTANPPAVPSGDLTGDGVVDVADALKALRIAAGLDTIAPPDLNSGDVAPLVSGTPAPDGVINLGDVVVLLRKAVGLVTW